MASVNPFARFAAVPADLDSLPKDELVRLLKRVNTERDELIRSNKKIKTSFSSSFNVEATKKRIASAATKTIKKTGHTFSKKPWTEISESLPDEAAALALMGGYEAKSNTARMIKWEFSDVANWLGTSPFIHPVKYEGRILTFPGEPVPKVYLWASYETVQIKFEKKTGHLTLKFRTYASGDGKRDDGVDAPLNLA